MVERRHVEIEHQAPTIGVRHLQCLLIYCGLAVAYGVRVNLSVGIVAMVDKNSANANFKEYDWSPKTQAIILSSFFWGYILTQIPAGQLAHKFGGKVMLLYSVLISGVLAIASPFCAELGNWQLFCVLRFVQGLSQGVMYPSTHTILAKWAPVEERDTLGTYSYSGAPFGTVAMYACSGILASSSLGWPSVFYIPGAISLIWVLAWIVWGASSPDEYKNISVGEKKLIESSLNQQKRYDESKVALKTPWSKIFSSFPFWVLLIVHCADCWGFWTLLTQTPTYMKNILNKDIKSNALLSALPYLAMLLLGFAFCGVSNVLGRCNSLSLTASRKLFNTIGMWIPAATLIAFGYVGAEQSNLAVVLLTLTIGLNSAVHLGFEVNHIDLTPNFAGILMGFTNTAANVMSIFAPLVVGFVVTDMKNPAQWRIVFFIAAGMYFFGNLLFICFGKTKAQTWNDAPQTVQELKLIAVEGGSVEQTNPSKSL